MYINRQVAISQAPFFASVSQIGQNCFLADPLFLSINVERKHPVYLSPFGDKLVFFVSDGFGNFLLYIATNEVFLSFYTFKE